MKEGSNQGTQDLKREGSGGGAGGAVGGAGGAAGSSQIFTLFQVWVCPMRMRALEEMMDKQKLMRMTERSDRMYLQQNGPMGGEETHQQDTS